MASTNVVWELTIYAPKSEDPTETTVLTPRPGSAHADPFVVTSAQGIAGTKPYLGIPKGRTGAIEPVTKRTTTGNLTLSVFDVRVTAGGGNAQRWSTAFVGDAFGRPRLKGCKFRLRRSLNGGAMTTYQTGRVRNISMSRALWLDLDVKDFADDLTRPIFTGAPHASVAGYAAAPALLPLGASQAWANLAVTPPLAGTLTKSAAGANGAPDVGSILLATPASPADAMVTKALLDASKGDAPRIVKVTVVATSAVGYFRWPTTDESTKQAADGRTMLSEREFVITGGPVKHYGVQKFPVWTLPASDSRFTAFPAGVGVGTAVTVQVFLDAPPSKTTPILIGDVHPVQYWADLLDGKYSRTYDYDAPRPLAGRDTSPGGPWATLIADLSFGTMRDVVDQQWKGSDYIEKVICQRFNLAYTFDESGRVVPVDLRRSASLAGVPTLTDDDLVAEVEPRWDDSRDGAITAVVYDYQVDTRLNAPDLIGSGDTYPDVVPSLVASEKSSVLIPNDLSTFRDVGEKVVTIDARATRVSSGDWLTAHFGLTRLQRVKAELAQAGADFLRPFGAGMLTASLTYRGASALAATVRPGMFRIINHSKLPNPATNERGGPRLVLALSVNDVEGGRIAIQWLDAGDGAVAVAPTITSIAAAGPTAVDVAVVLNAATDPADIWVAVTGTGVGVRPADSAAEWVLMKTAVASGTLRVTPLPDAKRVWVRAQAHGAAANVKLPSAWAYPPAPGYVDLSAGTPIDDGSEEPDNPPLDGGTPISPPIASLDFVSENDSQVVLALNGVVGSGGAGPLQYSTHVNGGAWSAWSLLHPNWTVNRAAKNTKIADLQVMQADGQVSAIASYAVTGANTAINSGTGQVDPTQPLSGIGRYIPRATDVNGWILDTNTKDDRGRLLNTGFQYAVDTAVGVVETAGEKFVNGAALDGSRNVDFASAAVINRHAANVLRIAGGASLQAIAQQLTDTGHAGSGMQDSRASLINAHFRYSVDGAAGVVESAAQSFIKQSYTDGSRRPVYVYSPTNGVDSSGDDLYTGQTRSRAGFRDSSAGLASGANDDRGSLVNSHFRKSVDDTTAVVPTTARGFVANVDGSNLITPASSSGRFRCKAFHGSLQTIADTTATILAFNNESYDSGGLHDMVTNNSRITIPSGGNVGIWMIWAQVNWVGVSSGAAGMRRIRIIKNGVTELANIQLRAVDVDAFGWGTSMNAVAIDDAPSVGDYYQVEVYQQTGGSRQVNSGSATTFSACHLW